MEFFRPYAGFLFWTLLPLLTSFRLAAQSIGKQSKSRSLHEILENVYDEMMPLCENLIGVSRGIAGFAALWYIASRVWRHIAHAETVDVYPLLRPFAIGICILLFPQLLALINGILNPTISATLAMVNGSKHAIEVLLKEKEMAIRQSDSGVLYSGQRDLWYKYAHYHADSADEIETDLKFAMEQATYEFRNSVKLWMSELLELFFVAAALCIDCLRTFQLVLLSLLGPFVLALSVFDEFQFTWTAWLARYINIYLWLPLVHIFGSIIGKVQMQMIRLDIVEIHNRGESFFSRTDTAYLVFLFMGTIGYFSIPSVANFIVQAGSTGVLGQRLNRIIGSSFASSIRQLERIQIQSRKGDYALDSTARSESRSLYSDNSIKGKI